MPGVRKSKTSAHSELRLVPIPLADEICPGDSLANKLLESLRRRHTHFQPGDILVVKHKVVSKSEGRLVDLATIDPSEESIAWAKQYALDARVIELAPVSYTHLDVYKRQFEDAAKVGGGAVWVFG